MSARRGPKPKRPEWQPLPPGVALLPSDSRGVKPVTSRYELFENWRMHEMIESILAARQYSPAQLVVLYDPGDKYRLLARRLLEGEKPAPAAAARMERQRRRLEAMRNPPVPTEP